MASLVSAMSRSTVKTQVTSAEMFTMWIIKVVSTSITICSVQDQRMNKWYHLITKICSRHEHDQEKHPETKRNMK